MLHFAYGSNIVRIAMANRCPGAVAIGLASVRGWRFTIGQHGYASIEQRPGAIVHGVIWRLRPRDLAALDAYENVAGGLYRRLPLTMRVDGRAVSGFAYVSSPSAAGRPLPGYLEEIVSAAREWGFPPPYITELKGWASPPRTGRPAEPGSLR